MDAVSTLRQIAYDLAKERESLEKILGSLKHIVVLSELESGTIERGSRIEAEIKAAKELLEKHRVN
jgi:hypothetical protein